MDASTVVALALLFALGAALYSSVGHGGASAYIAAMALFSVAPETMKPTALALNLLVAGFGAWRYWRRGLTNWKLLFAFAATAFPAAFIGGGIHLPAIYYKPLVGILLWLAAIRLLWKPTAIAGQPVHAPRLWISLPAGAVLGLLAGLTGTGGGMFLTPLIILWGWEEARRTSGVVAAFIFLDSAAGLAGNAASVGTPAARASDISRIGVRGRPARDLARRGAASAALAAEDARRRPDGGRSETAVYLSLEVEGFDLRPGFERG